MDQASYANYYESQKVRGKKGEDNYVKLALAFIILLLLLLFLKL